MAMKDSFMASQAKCGHYFSMGRHEAEAQQHRLSVRSSNKMQGVQASYQSCCDAKSFQNSEVVT